MRQQRRRRGLAGGEVQPGPVLGGPSWRTFAAQDTSRQGAISWDDHHLRFDPNVGEGKASSDEQSES